MLIFVNVLKKTNESYLACNCGNDIFITLGDDFGITVVQCTQCGTTTSLLKSTMIAEKQLSAYGEDYCRVYGHLIDDTIKGTRTVIVDYLVFTEFATKCFLSIDDRLQRLRAAKQDAIEKQWFERAARLREEEKIIDRYLQTKR